MTLNKNIKTVILVANKNELDFDIIDDSIAIYEIGVGKVNAVIALSKLYQQIQALEIKPILINVGTVGSVKYPIEHVIYPTYFAQGDAYTEGFFLENTKFLVGNGKIESVELEEFDYNKALLTSDRFINTTTAFYQDIKDLNAEAFDMEAYALADFCYQHQLPLYMIKIVSDNCDGTVKDWENILSKISRKLGQIVSDYLENINSYTLRASKI
jgi:adenosylhomocysteine nucleosidase